MREGRAHRSALLLLLVTVLCCGHGNAQCRTITDTNMACVVETVQPDPVNCNFQLKIYEDCPVDSALLTFAETGFAVGCDTFKLINDNTVSLKAPLDTEANPSVDCPAFITQAGVADVYVLVSVQDVNEREPLIDIGTTKTVNINENNPANAELLRFGVSDADSGELASLTFTSGPPIIASKFLLTKGACTTSTCPFTVTVLESLDYEAGMFYELEAQFTTGDSRGVTSSVNLTVLVFVVDEPDSPPFWSLMVPSYSVEESDEVKDLFTVEARDRDTSINNDIKYQIISGNELGLFSIDPNTGSVSTIKAIDREALASTFFNVQIRATEVLADGTDAPPPNQVEQWTIIQILDVNDITPTFGQVELTLDILEMTGENIPGDSITVTLEDQDQSDAGAYKIETSDAAHLAVSPASGSGLTTITITPVYVEGDNIFDSEGLDGVKEISFTVTATEVADSSHKSELKVKVSFTDVNDNFPEFSDPDTYATSISEATVAGEAVITVAATDRDVTDEFGTKSIRYSLLNCSSDLVIDGTTGVVTTARKPDYESTPVLNCNVQARDAGGSGRSTSVILSVTIDDVNDTPPTLSAQAAAEVLEDKPVTSVVLSVRAVDPDTTADVTFVLQYPDGTDDTVRGWFDIQMVDCGSGVAGFCGDVIVVNPLDREKLTQPYQVVITVLATDEASDIGPQTDTADVVITILDVNDVEPLFCNASTTGLTVQETAQANTAIARITASDPDEEDQGALTFSCSDNGKVDINRTTGVLFVLDGTAIDREEEEEFTVTLTVTDKANQSSKVEVTLTVLDINDNPPVLDEALCNGPTTVYENEITGYEVVQLTATDADHGAHGQLTYVLQNDILTSGINPYTPFAVSESGLVTVYANASIQKTLDREAFASWQLSIRVYDGCENTEFTCRSLMDECAMIITIEDINDMQPELLRPLTLYAGEELLMGDQVPNSVITAFDGDLINTTATQIHYTVVGFQDDAGQDLDIPFAAVNFHQLNSQLITEWSCRLNTTQNLANMTGSYTLLINASDGLEDAPVNTNTLSVVMVITDYNDNSPVIVLDTCLVDNDRIITIPEDTYLAGSAIPCVYGTTKLAQLRYTDEDADPPNNKANITIDYNKSKVDPANLYPGQLDSFELVQQGEVFTLYLKQDMVGNLSLELGKSYNLSVVATDLGNPPLRSTPDWIFVNLTERSEYDPAFCQDIEKCVATTYITEGTQEAGLFPFATDRDNIGNYTFDTIYYYVVYDLSNCFDIPSESVELHQLSPTCELDREIQAFYTVLVQATNTRVHPPLANSGDPVSTNMLQINVTIIDVNDKSPSFGSDVIFGSVLQSGSVGQEAAVMEASDQDLNETLRYSFSGDFQWEPQATYGVDVFRITNDSGPGTVLLAMNPSGLKGYCIVPVIVFDKLDTGDHNDTALMQIFIVESSDQVPFYFENDIETLEIDKENIAYTLSSVFRYEAFIDSMTPTTGTNNRSLDSVLEVHFVNTSAAIRNVAAPGNLVPKTVITSMASSGRLSTQLQQELEKLDLHLYKIGDSAVVEEPGLEQQLLTYQIVLGVVAMLLGSLVFLLLAAYIVRTRKLERRVKVLSTNTFGSKASDLDKTGLHMDVIPNSNLFKGEGANPMFNTSFKEFDRQDSGSLSSGDSVLVGVEDNPEFRDYTGGVRPSLGNTRDDSAFVGAGGMTSSNPLFANLDKRSEGGDTDSHVGGSSSSNDDAVSQEAGDLGVTNSNFSFM